MAEEKKKSRKKAKKKNSSMLDTAKQFSRFEMLFVIILFFSMFVWGCSKCTTKNSTSSNVTASTPSNANTAGNVSNEDVENYSPAAANNPNSPKYKLREDTVKVQKPKAKSALAKLIEETTPKPEKVIATENLTPLYVTLDNLKVREEPKLTGKVLTTLPLSSRVSFMDKRTDFREKLNIGNGEITNEPWLLIRTKSGQMGWVYGGGVHFFKWDRLRNPIPSISDGED